MTTNQPDSGNAAPPPPDGDGGGCQPGTTINPTVSAQPTGQVPPGTTVQLVARADAVTVRKDCSRSVQRIGSGTWSLTFEPPGGAERDETSMLSSATTLTTTFVAESEGIYRARFQAQLGLNTAFADVAIVAGVISLAPQRILEASSLSGAPPNNPAIDTSDPRWSAHVCHDRTIDDTANLSASDPTIEWAPILSPQDELNGDVGLSGTVVEVKVHDSDNDFSQDMPFSHPFYNDYRSYIVPDAAYMSLLAPGNLDPSDGDWIAANAAAQRLGISARGFIEMEIDRGLLPEAYRPREGDRIAVWGRWIVDCGHSIFSTEIHPPLVLASARAVSADTTSVRLVGRAFLVSQDYGGTALFPYIAREIARVNAEVIAAGGIGGIFLPPIAVRSRILSPPFDGIRVMVFVVRPPRPRTDPSERLLLSYHFVTRTGVSVQVAGGTAIDEVQVIVTLNDVNYKPAPEPPSHDILVPLEALQARGAALVELIVGTNPAAAPVLNQGVVTSRYDMPPPVSSQDGVNVVSDLQITAGPIPAMDTPEQPVDDSQPYPIYGWLSLGFAPSQHLSTDVAPGATAADNTVVFVAKSLDGRILYDYAQLGQGGHGWVELEGNGRTDAAPAAAAIGTYLFVAVKGLDRNIYINQGELGHPFTGWRASPNLQTDVAPALTSGANNIVFVAKSLDGRILYDYAQLGQGGHGWVELEGNGRTDAAPAAAAIGTYLFVAVKGLDGNIYLNQGELGGPFTGWQRYGG